MQISKASRKARERSVMKPKNRFQIDGLVDGLVQMTVVDDGFKQQIKVTPRKMLGIVAQLEKVNDKQVCTFLLPINGTVSPVKINQAEARQLVAETDVLMKWKR
jgi:hypothetical protein